MDERRWKSVDWGVVDWWGEAFSESDMGECQWEGIDQLLEQFWRESLEERGRWREEVHL